MKRKSLGVLVTSEKHGAHLNPLCCAAERKQIALAVHLQGEGVRLCLQPKYQDMMTRVHLSICHKSAEKLGLTGYLKTRYPGALTSDRNASISIRQCTRHIVL